MVPFGRVAIATAPAPSTMSPRAGRLRPIDILVLTYVAIMSLVVLARLRRFPNCAWIMLAHGLVVVLVFLVTRPALGRVGRALRELYPLILLVGLYSAIDVINGNGAIGVYDRVVQGWEGALFGGQPSRDWWMAAPSPFWSIVLHSAYLSYYLLILIPALYFAARGDLIALRRFVLAVMATFLICYLFFVLFPVAGPYYMYPHPRGAFVDNGPARLLYRGLAAGSSYGAAFPSSHVAATVAATISAWWGSRRLGLAMVVPTMLLTVAVVYCQMHYAVDAIAGLAVGGVVAPLSRLTSTDSAA